jgi:hypothetical protein
MRRPLFIGMIALGGALAGCATTGNGAQALGGGLFALQHADTDNDGSLTVAEAEQRVQARLAQLDPDGDGTLTQQELLAPRQGPDAPLSPQDREALFHSLDGDNDGTVSKDELMAAVDSAFAAADVDKDGTVTTQELDAPTGVQLLHLLEI